MSSTKYSRVASYELEDGRNTSDYNEESYRSANSSISRWRPRSLLTGPRWLRDKSSQHKKAFRLGLVLFVVLVLSALIVLPNAPDLPALPTFHEGEFDACPRLLGEAESGAQGLGGPSDSKQSTGDQSEWAEVMMPSQLIELVEHGKPLPRLLIHQSWKTRDLPSRFQKWSNDWRRIHGKRWTYVLWTDEDNRQLVEKFYPEYLETYNNLPREIFRADMIRNIYMHKFGGVYGDLDLIPLGPIDKHITQFLAHDEDAKPIAFVGHMGEDNFEHSIPNAFFAATKPGHPFFYKPLDYVVKHQNEPAFNREPEKLTGPVALRACVKEWQASEGKTHELRVLENGKIYPLNWSGAPKLNWCLCRTHSPWFNEGKCNALYENTAWTITYWTHSWS
ncbi:hypothetical protein FRC14_003018 [Serendipita sp. 396]|nr:hypothetical protein FRC14_003018 [Serendipita sp. 396]KAG8788517.1 hypothetical protein FRC15_003844 [Serendipita sp. 397]KAG8875014.1 hypothetical protein FRC20_004731 [Serendipita sp. 405]